MPDNAAKIAEMQETLDAGVKSTTVDGTRVEFDLEFLQRREKQAKQEDDVNGFPKRTLTKRITLN